MSIETDATACSVCGGAMTAATSAECNWCSERYHLNQRNDADGVDCGAVWIDEQYMALQFACNRCLAVRDDAPTPATPPRLGAPSRKRRYRRRA